MENPYIVLWPETTTMHGRSKAFQQILAHLVKEVPDHISIVGPRHYGKTVILRHLARHLNETGKYFVSSVHWDLRHSTPKNNQHFLRGMAVRIRDALKNMPQDIDFLNPESEEIRDLIDFCLEELEDKGEKILIILDGFDHVLSCSDITRDLWDTLRSFAQRRSLVLVTGSRSKLRELCRSEDSRTSDFWEIFYDSPLNVGAFDDKDWSKLVDPFKQRNITLDSSAMKELVNWTGGSPLLVAAMLRNIWENTTDGEHLSKPVVDKFALDLLDNNKDLLATLWEDCTLEIQSDLIRIAEKDSFKVNDLARTRIESMLRKGFLKQSGDKVRSSCRLMDQYAFGESKGIDDIRRLFDQDANFRRNIRSVLEMKISQIQDGDIELKNYVMNAIRDLARPKEAIVWARRIAEHSLDMIWDKELPKDRIYPREWVEEWKHSGETWSKNFDKFPQARGGQCYLLRVITGTQKTRKLSKYVSKSTYLLVDHIQSIGDYGQHQDDEASLGFAVAFCFSATELYASLTKDLRNIKFINDSCH